MSTFKQEQFNWQAASQANTVVTNHEQYMELQKYFTYPDKNNSVEIQTNYPMFI